MMTTISLEKFLPKVENQGSIGDCAEVALCNTINTMLIQTGKSQLDLSWMQLYNDTRSAQGTFNVDTGSKPAVMMHVAHDIGIADAQVFSNSPENLYRHPTQEVYDSAYHTRVISWNDIPLSNSQTGYHDIIKQALTQGKPVMMGINLYGDWFFNKQGSLSTQISEGPIGDTGEFVGHEVMIYGMDDTTGNYLVRNQWGNNWGEQGNGTISFTQLNIGLHPHTLINLTTLNSFGNVDLTWNKWTAEAATLYTVILDRGAETSGLHYWANLLQSGVSYRDAANAVMASPEALLTSQGSNLSFVESTYQNLLGRATDASGASYWTDFLNHGMTRGDFLNIISGYVHSDLCGVNDPAAHDFAVARQTMAQLTGITYQTGDNHATTLHHALDGITDMATLEIHKVGVYEELHSNIPPF